jgi:HD superfamily phosphohydrolase
MQTPEDRAEQLKIKRFKDPIYGYIEVQNDFVTTFIDTPCFQRLRYIVQTSYTSVYMTALHNRFTHSLGVYHLGKIVYERIKMFMQSNRVLFGFNDELIEWMTKHEEIFLAACLLHDVGHAPFSHTGEIFYDTYVEKFYDLFYQAVNTKQFEDDAKKYKDESLEEANAHERMSVLLALRHFKGYFETKEPEDREFFARCITGYKYHDTKTLTDQVKNCLIELLNSTLIDVDRLDYIIRDAFMSGYQNVSIDYMRLLCGMVIVRDGNKIVLAYHKNATSIIDNVIYAHDSERKWIQNHPVILYEIFLISHCIKIVQRFFDSKGERNHPFFSVSSLDENGNSIGPLFENDESFAILSISLLSDIDILYYIKNVSACQDELTREYFDRNSRRHPIWKSEGEYKHFFDDFKDKDKLNDLFTDIGKFFDELFDMHKLNILPVINDKALSIVDENIENEIRMRKNPSKLKSIKRHFEILKNFAKNQDIDFDFVILFANMFRSNFSKIEITKIKIWYPYDRKIGRMYPILDVAKSDNDDAKSDDGNTQPKEDKEAFFYFYYKRKSDTRITISHIVQLCNELVGAYTLDNSIDDHPAMPGDSKSLTFPGI